MEYDGIVGTVLWNIDSILSLFWSNDSPFPFFFIIGESDLVSAYLLNNWIYK